MKRPNRSNSLVSNYHRLPAPSRRRASRLRRPAASSSRWPSPSSPTSIWWRPSRAESRKPSSTRSKPIGRQRPCRRFSRVAWPPAAPLSKPIRNSDSVIIRWGEKEVQDTTKMAGGKDRALPSDSADSNNPAKPGRNLIVQHANKRFFPTDGMSNGFVVVVHVHKCQVTVS